MIFLVVSEKLYYKLNQNNNVLSFFALIETTKINNHFRLPSVPDIVGVHINAFEL